MSSIFNYYTKFRKEVQKAIDFATVKHAGQKDDDGIEYIQHPLQVADMLAALNVRKEVIIAAILHDTLEDTETTFEELKETFGEEIANLVLEVTHEGKADEHGYYYPNLKSKEAILLKLIDRACNINRMESWDDKRQQHYIKNSKFWRDK